MIPRDGQSVSQSAAAGAALTWHWLTAHSCEPQLSSQPFLSFTR